MFCLSVCLCATCMPSAQRGQKRGLDPLELPSMGAGKQIEAQHILSPRTISLALPTIRTGKKLIHNPFTLPGSFITSVFF